MNLSHVMGFPYDPKAIFRPLDVLPRDCEHRIPYADISLLTDMESDRSIVRQSVSGWQFDMWLYTCRGPGQTVLTLRQTESRVLFIYALAGTFRYINPSGSDIILPAHCCVPIYFPEGQHLIKLDAPLHSVFGFSIPLAYFVWLARHFPILSGFKAQLKALSEMPVGLPVCKQDSATWRTLTQVKGCPKRGAELDGALKVYIARFVTLYAVQLANRRLSGKVRREQLLIQLEAYLEERYNEPSRLSSAALTAEFQISAAHLRRIFRNHHGMSIREQIQMLRIAAAKELLDSTHLSIAGIAERVGYEYADSLIKVFKKHLGLSPTAYRRR